MNVSDYSALFSGDNMLTAMSVARECEMVKPGERLILVQALPPGLDNYGNPTSAPVIEFVHSDPPESETKRQGSVTQSDKVKPWSDRLTDFLWRGKRTKHAEFSDLVTKVISFNVEALAISFWSI